MKELIEPADFEQCLNASEEKPVLIFKHSTRCPISSRADEEVRKYCAEATPDDPECYMVKVVEARPLSLSIADALNVPHQSPQLILVDHRAPVWSASHYGITQEAIRKAVGSSQRI